MNKLRRLIVPALAIGLTLCSFSLAPGQRNFIKPDEVNNAALIYWQSFALLPNLDEEQTSFINELELDVWSDNPGISREEGKQLFDILDQCDESIRLMDQIGDDTSCDWGIVFVGPGTNLAHMAKARLLGKLLQLSGEKALMLGMHDLAAMRFAQALRLGRNLGNDALILQLVGERIEEYVVSTVTRHIENAPGKEGAKHLAEGLVNRIEKLPARPSVADAYRNEKQYFHNWIKKVLLSGEEVAPEELKAAEALIAGEGWIDFLKSSPVADRERGLEGMAKYYDKLIEFGEDEGDDLESRLNAWTQNADGEIERSALIRLLPTAQPIIRSRERATNWKAFSKSLQKLSR